MASTNRQSAQRGCAPEPCWPLVQIAGVHDAEEARTLCDCGVDWIGFPLRLPVHREDLTEPEAAAVIRRCALRDRAVLITYLDRARDIAALCRELDVYRVQIHGEIDTAEIVRLRTLLPEASVMKSLVVRAAGNVAELEAVTQRFEPHVDAFITDTFDPATGASGATGMTHDWAVSRRLVELSAKPVVLAGGLTPANVREAVGAVRPAGVDAHTGVEGPDGRKDPLLVRRFVAEAQRGFAALGT